MQKLKHSCGNLKCSNETRLSCSISFYWFHPTYGWPKAGRLARTYIQQLCEDTGCSPEDLPEAMNDREKWRERVRDIRATSTTWWWWWRTPKVLFFLDGLFFFYFAFFAFFSFSISALLILESTANSLPYSS